MTPVGRTERTAGLMMPRPSKLHTAAASAGGAADVDIAALEEKVKHEGFRELFLLVGSLAESPAARGEKRLVDAVRQYTEKHASDAWKVIKAAFGGEWNDPEQLLGLFHDLQEWGGRQYAGKVEVHRGGVLLFEGGVATGVRLSAAGRKCFDLVREERLDHLWRHQEETARYDPAVAAALSRAFWRRISSEDNIDKYNLLNYENYSIESNNLGIIVGEEQQDAPRASFVDSVKTPVPQVPGKDFTAEDEAEYQRIAAKIVAERKALQELLDREMARLLEANQTPLRNEVIKFNSLFKAKMLHEHQLRNPKAFDECKEFTGWVTAEAEKCGLVLIDRKDNAARLDVVRELGTKLSYRLRPVGIGNGTKRDNFPAILPFMDLTVIDASREWRLEIPRQLASTGEGTGRAG